MNLRERLRNALESPVYNIIMAILVLFSVFAWDIAHGWLPVSADGSVELLMTVVFFAFVLEIITILIAVDRWWRDGSVWVIIFATVMMSFEIPWMQKAFVLSSGTGALANFRLIRVFRLLARLGRLLRILKSLILGNIRTLVSKLIRRNSDADEQGKSYLANRKKDDDSRKKSFDALERATTFAVVAIFSLMYVMAMLYMGYNSRADPTVSGFERISTQYRQYASAAPYFADSDDRMLYLSFAGREYIDRREAADSLRNEEVDRLTLTNGDELWLDVSLSTRRSAREEAILTLVFIISISYLVVVFNWLISRFALNLSGALNTLAQALEERDAYTRMHSRNVSTYAARVAEGLGLSKQEKKILRIAAELHDVGKIGVPQEILGKPAPLNDEEYAVMKRHTEQGANILHHLVDFEAVILAACHHHEKFDGTGYPQGLEGKNIPRMARILSVCDVWDALTTDRPYRKAMETEKAKRIILEGRGTDFDPEIVDAFVTTIE